jgi:hypothetical protein
MNQIAALLDNLPSIKRYRIVSVSSPASPYMSGHWQLPLPGDGEFAIYCGSHILMRGRTFSRDSAEAICEALEEAAEAGFEEGVEG